MRVAVVSFLLVVSSACTRAEVSVTFTDGHTFRATSGYGLASGYGGGVSVRFDDEDELSIDVTSLIGFPLEIEEAALQSKLTRAEWTGFGGSPVRLTYDITGDALDADANNSLWFEWECGAYDEIYGGHLPGGCGGSVATDAKKKLTVAGRTTGETIPVCDDILAQYFAKDEVEYGFEGSIAFGDKSLQCHSYYSSPGNADILCGRSERMAVDGKDYDVLVTYDIGGSGVVFATNEEEDFGCQSFLDTVASDL